MGMGIDLKHKHLKNKNRLEPRTQDVYHRMLVKLYRFLARRTESDFNKTVLKRLCMSNNNRPSISFFTSLFVSSLDSVQPIKDSNSANAIALVFILKLLFLRVALVSQSTWYARTCANLRCVITRFSLKLDSLIIRPH